MKTPLLITALLVLLPSAAGADVGDKPLSLRECEEFALKNQPSITVAQQGVAAAQGRETQARSSYFPQMSASTGYSENRTEGGAFGAGVTKSYTTTLQL